METDISTSWKSKRTHSLNGLASSCLCFDFTMNYSLKLEAASGVAFSWCDLSFHKPFLLSSTTKSRRILLLNQSIWDLPRHGPRSPSAPPFILPPASTVPAARLHSPPPPGQQRAACCARCISVTIPHASGQIRLRTCRYLKPQVAKQVKNGPGRQKQSGKAAVNE